MWNFKCEQNSCYQQLFFFLLFLEETFFKTNWKLHRKPQKSSSCLAWRCDAHSCFPVPPVAEVLTDSMWKTEEQNQPMQLKPAEQSDCLHPMLQALCSPETNYTNERRVFHAIPVANCIFLRKNMDWCFRFEEARLDSGLKHCNYSSN